MNRYLPTFLIVLSCSILLCLFSCNGLTKEAKEIAGNYYNTELSDTQPVMELGKDGRCVITAIKPGVLTYSVEGKWNVKNDSLILDLDPSTLKVTGDESLVGYIPTRMAQLIHSHADMSLQVERDGVVYSYRRQN
ncbi:MAG: hypothetical protein K2K55_05020 [Duncaniella sp.]|nr:hypothetical protein [Duncaniella sp.]